MNQKHKVIVIENEPDYLELLSSSQASLVKGGGYVETWYGDVKCIGFEDWGSRTSYSAGCFRQASWPNE